MHLHCLTGGSISGSCWFVVSWWVFQSHSIYPFYHSHLTSLLILLTLCQGSSSIFSEFIGDPCSFQVLRSHLRTRCLSDQCTLSYRKVMYEHFILMVFFFFFFLEIKIETMASGSLWGLENLMMEPRNFTF